MDTLIPFVSFYFESGAIAGNEGDNKRRIVSEDLPAAFASADFQVLDILRFKDFDKNTAFPKTSLEERMVRVFGTHTIHSPLFM